MLKIWNRIDELNLKAQNKYRLVLFVFSVLAAAFGALLWFSIGQKIFVGLDSAVCFIGYPVILSWLLVFFYSCRHSFH